MTQVKERSKSPAKTPRVTDRRRLKKIFTAEDLLHLPDSPDGRRYELVEGKLYEMPPPGQRHGRVTLRAGMLLETYAQQHQLGRVIAGDPGFLLGRDPDTVRAPDVAFVSYQRLPADREFPLQYNDIVPEIAIEVVSPSDTERYIREKAQSWLQSGVREVWAVDPATRQLTVYRPGQDSLVLQEGDTLADSTPLPGFTCFVADFFS